MARVKWSTGIEYVSGALCKCGKKGHHRHTQMLLATHRVAETESTNCNNIYLREDKKRSTPVTTDELFARMRFTAVGRMVRERRMDLSKITQDQMTFIAQRDTAGGKKTLRSWYWKVCGQEWDAQHPRG